MGFDNDCILNIQSLSGEYFCAVCCLLVYPNEALQAPCTHLFCKPCLTYAVSTNHACPYDGYRVTEADSKPLVESNKTLADTIGKIQVHCLYYRTGCTWQGSLSDCTSHCATCGFGESPVLCNRCGIQLVHRQVQEHAQNCLGAQSQGQQPSATQGAASTGAGSGTDQSQPVDEIGALASQGPVSQATSVPASSQVTNQPANSATQTQATQPQAAQAAAPSLDQWYQQQYQQYYQQLYPGYDAYQQNYQYYYAQQQPPAQPPVQSQPPQAPPAGQPQPQPQAQPGAMQVQIQTHVQAQAGQMYGQPQQQAQATQTYGQNQQQAQTAQLYPHPQHPVPHQQMQPPHPQSYPQSQTQHYPYPQNQGPLQTPPQPNPQAPYPPQQNQPVPGPQLQGQNPVTGFQSYPQPHPPQVQAPQIHPTSVHQQPQYGGQMHRQFPSQPSQMRPPQSYPTVPTQQQPALGPPAQQLPVYPHGHRPGYGVPHRPGIQAVPQQHVQQFPGQAPIMQPQLHAQGSSQIPPQTQQNYAAPPGAHPNMAQNYAGRPMVPQGAVSQPYGQVRPVHPNQTYPMKANDQLSVVSEQPVHPQQLSKIVNGEKPLDQKPEKAIMGDDQSKEVRNITGVTGLNQAINGNEGKKDVSLESASELPGGYGTESKLVGDHDQRQQRLKENVATSAAEDINVANLKDTKHTVKGKVGAPASASVLPQSHLVRQGHSGPLAQVRHGVPSMPHGMPHPGNMQQPALPGLSTNQLRPQGPGQVPAGPPFHAGYNAPPSAPFDKPGNVGQYHPRTPQGEPFVRPSFPAQRSCAFDSHGGVIGREAIEPRPSYPLENEQFPSLRMDYSNSRHPDPHFHGPVEGALHGNIPLVQLGSSKFSGPSGHVRK